jgi:hypothetical protein
VAVGPGLDEHVRGESREAVGDSPHVEVVGLDHTFVLDQAAADVAPAEQTKAPLPEDPPDIPQEL